MLTVSGREIRNGLAPRGCGVVASPLRNFPPRLVLRPGLGLERLNDGSGSPNEFGARAFPPRGQAADARAFQKQRERVGERLRLNDAGSAAQRGQAIAVVGL